MNYDVIVLGLGGVGGAAAFHAARRGLRVLGLEQYQCSHDLGSSHGQTRVIRQAYFEHPGYVPLLHRAYEHWDDLSRRQGETLLVPCGLLQVGPSDGVVVPGVLASARRHGLEVETLSPAEVLRRWPQLHVGDHQAVFERRAGYLFVDRCVLGHVQQAQLLGAELRAGETVLGWQSDGDGISVTSDRATYRAGRLIVAAGAWSARLLASLGLKLSIRRKEVYWFGPAAGGPGANLPCFLYELPEGVFYGVPRLPPWGLKVAEHSRGEAVDDPAAVSRQIEPGNLARVKEFMTRNLHMEAGELSHASVCMYTMSPDEHFIVDVDPNEPRLCFAAGLSGHGFKFVPVLGEALVDLAVNGRTELPIEFLSCRRAAVAEMDGTA